VFLQQLKSFVLHPFRYAPWLLALNLLVMSFLLAMMLDIRTGEMQVCREDRALWKQRYIESIHREDGLKSDLEISVHSFQDLIVQTKSAIDLVRTCEARRQFVIGERMVIHNECIDCDFRIPDLATLERVTDLCRTPMQYPAIQSCLARVANQSCSPDGISTCANLLVCREGSWQVNCAEYVLRMERDLKKVVP